MEVDFAEAVSVLAEGGEGLAWVPERVARAALGRGSLVRAGAVRDEIDFEIRLYRNAANRRSGVEGVWARVARHETELARSATPTAGPAARLAGSRARPEVS